MTDPSARTFSSDFKRFFLRGLVVLLPTLLTLWIVVAAYQFVDRNIAEPINHGVRLAMYNLTPHWDVLAKNFSPSDAQMTAARAEAIKSSTGQSPPSDELLRNQLLAANISAWWNDHWYMNLIGLVVAIVGVYIAGRVLGGYIGRGIYRRLERLLVSVPVFKQVYPYIKQIVDFLFSDEKQMSFNRVVMAEYPRKGIWSMGFHTGPTLKSVKEAAGEALTVFIPCAPTPFTGYVICVPRKDVIEVDITVEEAVRFIVSAGVVVPERELEIPADSTISKLRSARQLVSTGSGEKVSNESDARG
jgi:uncharacterized membrane protein